MGVIGLYYGKQIYDDGQVSYISSSQPLPYSNVLIQLSQEEFNIAWEKIKRDEKLKEQAEKAAELEEIYKPELTEPEQIIMIKEKDLEDVEET